MFFALLVPVARPLAPAAPNRTKQRSPFCTHYKKGMHQVATSYTLHPKLRHLPSLNLAKVKYDGVRLPLAIH